MAANASKCLREMNEALVMEDLGSKISFIPVGCHMRKSKDDDTLWKLFLPVYNPSVVIYFYVDNLFNLTAMSVLDGGQDHAITTEEQSTLEEVCEWLYNESIFEENSHGKA